jgi:hypothetical protein
MQVDGSGEAQGRAGGHPVARVAENVPFELPLRLVRSRAKKPGWLSVHVPTALEEGHEPVALARQDIEDAVAVPSDLAPDRLRYLGGAPAGPEHLLDDEARRRA